MSDHNKPIEPITTEEQKNEEHTSEEHPYPLRVPPNTVSMPPGAQMPITQEISPLVIDDAHPPANSHEEAVATEPAPLLDPDFEKD